MTVSVLKLVTGDELIGDVQEMEFEGKNVLRVKHPALLMYRQNEDGTQYSIGMAPYALSSRDNIIPIFPGQIVSIYDPSPVLEERWTARYGADVILNGDPDDIHGSTPVPEYLAEQLEESGEFLLKTDE